MKKIFMMILLILMISLIDGCDYYPWTQSTGTSTSKILYLKPAVGGQDIILALSDDVFHINYGASYFSGGPTFNTVKNKTLIKAEIIVNNSYEVAEIRNNALLIEITHEKLAIKHFFIIKSLIIRGGTTWSIFESRAIMEINDQYQVLLFPIFLLDVSIPLELTELKFTVETSYPLLESTIADFILYYEKINTYHFTYSENTITIEGIKNEALEPMDELLTHFSLIFDDDKVRIELTDEEEPQH